MDMHDLLKKIGELSVITESKKEETHKGGTKSSDAGVTKHKGKYGTEYQGDEDDESEEGKKKKKAKAADAPKRGRGRPKKDADSSTGQVAKYANAAGLQSFMVGNLPKDKKGKPTLPGKASKKHSLKEWFDEIDEQRVLGEAQTTLKPGQIGFTGKDGSTTVLQTTDTTPAGQAATKFIQGLSNAGKIIAAPTNTTPNTSNTATSTTAASSSTQGTVASMEESDGDDKGGKKWIKGAIKKPGAFTKKAKAHGKTTAAFSKEVLANKEKYPAKTEKQAVLAKTLSKLGKGKKESVEEADVPNRDATMSPLSQGGKIQETDKPAKKAPSKTSAKSGSWKNSFHESKEQGVAEGSGDPDIRPGMKTKHGTVVKVSGNTVTVKASNGELTNISIYDIQQGMAEGKKVKPDFPDVDDDGNRKESIKSAAASAKAVKSKSKNVSEAGEGMSRRGFLGAVGAAGLAGAGAAHMGGSDKTGPAKTKEGAPRVSISGVEVPFYRSRDEYKQRYSDRDTSMPLPNFYPRETPLTVIADNGQKLSLYIWGQKGVYAMATPMAAIAENKMINKKKPVKEGHDTHQAAFHEGKCHAYENGHYRCRHEQDSEEARKYHAGFMEGLEECYGGGGMMQEGGSPLGFDEHDPLMKLPANYKGTSSPHSPEEVVHRAGSKQGFGNPKEAGDLLDYTIDLKRGPAAPVRVSPEPAVPSKSQRQMPGQGLPVRGVSDSPLQRGIDAVRRVVKGPNRSLEEEQFMAELDALDEEMMDEMNKTDYMKQQARKTPGSTFKAFGQTMHDKDVLESGNDFDVQMESWDRDLNKMLNESVITEGVTVTTSTGQPGGTDSVSISATDEDAHRLMQMLSNAGMSVGMGGSSHGDSESGHEDVPAMARPRGFGMSQNVDSGDCEVVTPYSHDEISSALGSGGSAMSQLRTKLLALEAKGQGGAMEMPDGKGFSVQHEEDEPDDTPEALEPYDFEEVQGALEKGGSKTGADKKSPSKKSTAPKADDKSDDADKEEVKEGRGVSRETTTARPRGLGVSVPVEEESPKAPKPTEQRKFMNSKGKDHKTVRESAKEIEQTPQGVPTLGFNQFHDPDNSEEQTDVEVYDIDDVQDSLDKGHSKSDEGSKSSDKNSHEDSYGDTEVADQEETMDNDHMKKSNDGEKKNDSFASIYENFMRAISEDSMPMPKGNGFSVPGEAKEKMQDGPADVDVEDQDSVLDHLDAKDTYQQDEFEKAFSKLKSLIQAHSAGESKKSAPAKSSESNDESDDGEEKKIDEGNSRCDECGAMYEGSHEDHECKEGAEKLDEWSNSLRGSKDADQLAQESFMADEEYMMNTITGGLNGKKRDQTVMPYTSVKIRESSDEIDQLRRLSGTR